MTADAAPPVGLARKIVDRYDAVPFSREATALIAILVVMQFFPGGVHTSSYVIGVQGAAPLVLSATAIVLIYRSNRFINFSQLSMAALAGTFFDGLARGRAVLSGVHALCSGCVGDQPGNTAIAINFWISAVLAILASGLVGYVIYAIVIRRFSGSPVLISTIVTIFLAQALTGAENQVTSNLVPQDKIMAGILPSGLTPPESLNVTIGGVPLHLSDLLLVAAAVLVIAGISAFLRLSAVGSAIRAAAENPGRASTLGIDVGAVTGRVWGLAGLLAGIVGVLQAFNGVTPPASTSSSGSSGSGIPVNTLVLVLAIVVLARFTSVWLVGLGAVVFSVLQAAVQSSFSSTEPFDAAYVFIIGGLLLLQRGRGSRADREDFSGLELTRELRGIPPELKNVNSVKSYRRYGGGLGIAALLAMPFILSLSGTSLFTDAMLTAVVGLSLLVLTGWGGQVSLGQFGFAAIGAWAAAVSGLPYVFALLLAGIVGGVSAVIVGLPALKLRGLNLAVSTLAFAVSAGALFVDPRYLGSYLPATLKAPKAFGLSLANERVTYYVALAVTLFFCVAVVGLRRSRTGRVLIALRSNEAAGQSFGINPLRARLTAFSVSGFMAAVAGAMLAFHLGRVSPDSFTADRSLTVFIFAVIGGLGGLAGPLVGLGFYAIITFFFADNPLIQYTAGGLGALLLLYVAPGGLAQLLYNLRDAGLRRVAQRMRISVASLVGERRAGLGAERVPLDEKREGPRKAGDDLPVRYKPAGQWALDRFGSADADKERVGVR